MKKILTFLIGLITYSASASCDYTLSVSDQYGDGWGNAYIEVYINGSNIGWADCEYGYYSMDYIIPVNDGDIITLYYKRNTMSGEYNSEHSFSLYKFSDNILCYRNSMPNQNRWFCNITAECDDLPVELLEFKSDCTTSTWKTASESNSESFELLFNGTTLCVLDAAGYSNELKEYSCEYTINESGLITLVQKDFDGRSEYFYNYIACNCEDSDDYVVYDISGKKVSENVMPSTSGMYLIVTKSGIKKIIYK